MSVPDRTLRGEVAAVQALDSVQLACASVVRSVTSWKRCALPTRRLHRRQRHLAQVRPGDTAMPGCGFFFRFLFRRFRGGCLTWTIVLTYVHLSVRACVRTFPQAPTPVPAALDGRTCPGIRLCGADPGLALHATRGPRSRARSLPGAPSHLDLVSTPPAQVSGSRACRGVAMRLHFVLEPVGGRL